MSFMLSVSVFVYLTLQYSMAGDSKVDEIS